MKISPPPAPHPLRLRDWTRRKKIASGEKSPGQGSHRMAKSRQEEAEAHIGTRTLPPKTLFCRAVGKELSIAGVCKWRLASHVAGAIKELSKSDGRLGCMASETAVSQGLRMWLLLVGTLGSNPSSAIS